jgi:hypothetical protein
LSGLAAEVAGTSLARGRRADVELEVMEDSSREEPCLWACLLGRLSSQLVGKVVWEEIRNKKRRMSGKIERSMRRKRGRRGWYVQCGELLDMHGLNLNLAASQR